MVGFGKIALKKIREGSMASRGEIFLNLQKNLKVPLTGLKPIRSGFHAFTETETDIDRL